jgi:hypothetical protein
MNLTGGHCAECLAPVNGGSAGHRREISCIPAPNRAGRGNHAHQRASKKSPRLLAEAEATARALVHGGGGPSVINAATMELVMDGQLVRPARREWRKGGGRRRAYLSPRKQRLARLPGENHGGAPDSKVVLKDGPCRAGPARARRASGFKVSGRAGTNYFQAGPYRAYRLK